MEKHSWYKANLKLVPCFLLLSLGLILSFAFGTLKEGRFDHRVLGFIGVIMFVVFAITFLHILTRAIRSSILAHELGIGRAAGLQFIIGVIGYLTIIFVTLDRLGLAIGHLLLGSAVLGIILGVAAQQALANFFASIILILSHPYAVGERVTLNSGALGGKYSGLIVDIGITHTSIEQDDGQIVSLPNSTILTSTAIMPERKKRTHSS